jgi:hypothetical protein
LTGLSIEVERVFEAYGWGWDLGNAHFGSVKDLRHVIGNFNDVDAGSYAFRYPVDTKGEPSLQKDFGFNLLQGLGHELLPPTSSPTGPSWRPHGASISHRRVRPLAHPSWSWPWEISGEVRATAAS